MVRPRAPQPLDRERADHGHEQRGPQRPHLEQQSRGDAGEREVADAVAHERQALLHEEDADQRRAHADRRARPRARAACTRGRTATAGAAPRARPRTRSRLQLFEPARQVVGVDAEAHAGGRELGAAARRRAPAASSPRPGRGRRPPRRARGRRGAPPCGGPRRGAPGCRGRGAARERRRRRSARRGRAGAARSPARARSSTRCCCPPESSPTGRRRRSVRATASRAWSTASRSLAPGEPPPPATRGASRPHDLLDGGRDVEVEDARRWGT